MVRMFALAGTTWMLIACDPVIPTSTPEPEPLAANSNESDPAPAAAPAPDPHAFQLTLANNCPKPWRAVILEGADDPHRDPAVQGAAVADDEYFAVESGTTQELTMHPGDVLWLMSSTGGSVPIGFDDKDQGHGVRLIVADDCTGVRTIRTVGG